MREDKPIPKENSSEDVSAFCEPSSGDFECDAKVRRVSVP